MSIEKVKAIIQKAVDENNGILVLDSSTTNHELCDDELNSLIPELKKITNLDLLTLSRNKLTDVSNLKELHSLKSLQLNHNKLKTTDSLKNLSNLTMLDIVDNNLSYAEPLKELKHLRILRLGGNSLTNIDFLENLTSLHELNLTNNKITNIESIRHLKSLVSLDLGFNNLTNVDCLNELVNLTNLGLYNNKITNIEFLKDLTELTRLFIYSNELTNLESITNLTKLADLDIHTNPLKNLNFLTKFKNLRMLWIDSSQLKNSPEAFVSLREKTNLNGILVWHKGKLRPIPPEFLTELETGQELLNYFESITKEETRELNEIKVLVVGEASVGKSSLIERLVNNRYNTKRNPTEGIVITKNWKVKINGREVQPNVWDFGGQEIMHATHQFFLTRRSLYILLLDSTVDEEANRINYWLEKIKILGGQSPVIIVKNKVDLKSLALNQKGLTENYPNIKGFYDVSCENGDGIETIKQKLFEEIGKVEGIHDQLPKTWFDVKEALECKDVDYISYQTYQEICQQKGVDKEDEDKLIGTLHNLGIVLNFRKDDLVRDETNVLNPQWVTEGVYKIINSPKLFESKGVLSLKMLEEILVGDKYPYEKQKFIVKMMEKFELCFEIPDERNQFLIPDLLSKDTLDTGDWEKSLHFEFHYNIFFLVFFHV